MPEDTRVANWRAKIASSRVFTPCQRLKHVLDVERARLLRDVEDDQAALAQLF